MSAYSIGRLPLGVALLAVLIGIFGLFVLLVGLLGLLFGLAVGAAAGPAVFGYSGVFGALVLLLVGAVILAVSVGLWNQELWALVLAILVLGFYEVIAFVSASWVVFLIGGALLLYLALVSGHFD